MSYAPSVLRNVSRAEIRTDPFPHIVIADCLPLDTYNELAATYPGDETILRLSGAAEKYYIRQNHRYDLCAYRALANRQAVGQAWCDFVEYHVSEQFFREFVALFGQHLQETYPELEGRFGRKAIEWTTGVRFDPAAASAHVALDCQIGINTRAQRMSSTRSVHTDAPDELFAMLLYFRPPNDRVAGGNFEIYRWKPGVPRCFVGREADPHDAELVGTIEYSANTLVGFINSGVSLHGVSPRAPSETSRRLVNIVGRVHQSVPEGLFVRPQKPGLGAMRSRMRERIGDRMNRRPRLNVFSGLSVPD
ncbi:MAG: hypothetical protein KGO48_06400 [Alphaproteobacteria bacterium]|nr:hypothetical protein [Alphaproteobacteria bacterium]